MDRKHGSAEVKGLVRLINRYEAAKQNAGGAGRYGRTDHAGV